MYMHAFACMGCPCTMPFAALESEKDTSLDRGPGICAAISRGLVCEEQPTGDVQVAVKAAATEQVEMACTPYSPAAQAQPKHHPPKRSTLIYWHSCLRSPLTHGPPHTLDHESRREAWKMFDHGFSNYMRHAFPMVGLYGLVSSIRLSDHMYLRA